nr:hypothetical protein [Deltaproteobacteria bacterium]
LTVSPEGKALSSEYTIERLEADDATGSHVLLRPRQVVTITRAPRGAEARVTVAGRPVDRPVREALGVVVSLSIGGVNDDEVFGTTQRQAVGAAWPLNAEVAQRDLLRTANVTATLSGQTRINGLATVQRTPCLDVSAEMNGTITAMADLPPRSSVRSGTMHVTMRGDVPRGADDPDAVEHHGDDHGHARRPAAHRSQRAQRDPHLGARGQDRDGRSARAMTRRPFCG